MEISAKAFWKFCAGFAENVFYESGRGLVNIHLNIIKIMAFMYLFLDGILSDISAVYQQDQKKI